MAAGRPIFVAVALVLVALISVALVWETRRAVDPSLGGPSRHRGPTASTVDTELLPPEPPAVEDQRTAQDVWTAPLVSLEVGRGLGTEPYPTNWEEKYKDVTLGQAIDAKRAVLWALGDKTKDYYEAAFLEGRYELSYPTPREDGKLPIPVDPDILSSFIVSPEGEMKMVNLPKEGFDTAYAMKEELLWLSNRIGELKRERRRPDE